eukprot:gb/GECG01014727.1/.p1 GENE.gb/GECG01014727.1/~~gb/GECG01014727.1/.p1  ORF type:complete len:107 (+),score=5.60 gb/GECG01014727.1/:1-321(+)
MELTLQIMSIYGSDRTTCNRPAMTRFGSRNQATSKAETALARVRVLNVPLAASGVARVRFYRVLLYPSRIDVPEILVVKASIPFEQLYIHIQVLWPFIVSKLMCIF